METKRDQYIEGLQQARAGHAITLVYANGRTKLFNGPLHTLDYSDLRFELKAGTAEPLFRLEPKIQFGNYKPIGRVNVFSKPSKMRAPSFSLPAGPPQLGGTCVAAGKKRLVEDDALFVCHGCYAVQGNYSYGSTQLCQAVRRIAVKRTVKEGFFTEMMVQALRQFQIKPRRDSIKEKVDGKKRVVGHRTLDSEYLRVHDSGDAMWLDGYLEGLVQLAWEMPGTQFWLPGRDWAVGPVMLRKIQHILARAPDNFVMRPSALHIGDPAPNVPGLAEGTSVSFKPLKKSIAKYNCPAYDQDLDKSCQSAECRKCWEEPETSVNYEPHGARMKLQSVQEALARRAQRNPQPELDEAYDAYLALPKHNPAEDEGFNAWLSRQGLAYDEQSWWELLQSIGLDGDETAEYLENVAEWQP